VTSPSPSDASANAKAHVNVTPTATAHGPWQAFQRAHLFDYNPAARRLWLALVLAGVGALVWALLQVAAWPWSEQWPTLIGLTLVALAARFPVRVPRSKLSIGVADIFIFTLLASVGTPAAVLAAGTEGLIACWCTSRRLSSWLASPTVAMASMLVAGHLFGGTLALLPGVGLDAGAAGLLALCVFALLHFVGTALPFSLVLALKKGQGLDLRAWWGNYAWAAAIYLGAATVAGFAHLTLSRYGPGVVAVGGVAVLGVVLLLRASLDQQERDRQGQELRIAQAEHEAQLNQQRFTAAFAHAGVGMAIVDAEGRILQVNRSLCGLLGKEAAQLTGQTFIEHVNAGDVELFLRQLQQALVRAEPDFSMELRCRGPKDEEVWVALHCSRFDDPGSTGTCLIYQLHDITSRHLAESRLQHIAFHDGLTDLANRHCFQQRLGVAVERSRLDAGQRFAVLFLDLDRFKIVNDSLGHVAGNLLLREMASRLRDCVRPTDLVARLGGDEFAILLEAMDSVDDAARLAERVLARLSQPVSLNGTEILPGASIGITFSDMAYRCVDEVLRDADLAMYEAKATGRGRTAFFDIRMHERIADRLALEVDLRHAIGAGQLSMVFQPLFHLDPCQPYGFEALARWIHPERGPISPEVFIGLAEESGHIEALTRWVIDHSVDQLARWHKQAPHLAHLGMHVNVSGRDLAWPGLVAHVQAALARHQLAAGHLTLEITETVLMSQLDVALRALEALREIGVKFSIDDFGTGYSSLAYLSTLPIDSLKIDRTFVMGMHERPQNVEIVRAVLNLGRSLGKKVIAEGIETPEQLAALRRLGVPIGQGYLLSRPLSAAQVLPWLMNALLLPA
jgi:diguanylate cyclase (GGDEF)-like protein/PAS domain S-box-containing protein